MQKDINKLIDLTNLANQKIKTIKKFLEKNNWIFDTFNLKLHNIYSYCFDNNMSEDIFNHFCENEYNDLNDYCYEKTGLEFLDFVKRIGRSNNFHFEYIIPNIYSESNFKMIDFLFDKLGFRLTDFFENTNLLENYNPKLITNFEKYLKEIRNFEKYNDDLEWLIDNLYVEFLEYYKECKLVYDYISNFKENQIEYFKDYIA